MTIAPLLTTLPPEIVLLISEHLDALELVQLSRTCRTLNYFGGCKYVAKALMRRRSPESAINSLFSKFDRIDLVIELYRHVSDKSFTYDHVTHIAARLNDLKQLEAWRAEFGFIPACALVGAARSNRIETFDAIFSRIELDDGVSDRVFQKIGECGNRVLLEHLRTKYPEMVTPERLETVVECSAKIGRLDFALYVFDSLSPRSPVVKSSACHIAKGAAEFGNEDVFIDFIRLYQYDDVIRNEIAELAAGNNCVEILWLQEGTNNNSARWMGSVLLAAVTGDAFEALQVLLDFGRNLSADAYSHPLAEAVWGDRPAMVRLLMTRVPAVDLLQGALDAPSLEMAVMLFKEYQKSERERFEEYTRNLDIERYMFSADTPDWKVMIAILVMGLDEGARGKLADIGNAERARYLSVLPAAIDLARELNFSEDSIDQMNRLANE